MAVVGVVAAVAAIAAVVGGLLEDLVAGDELAGNETKHFSISLPRMSIKTFFLPFLLLAHSAHLFLHTCAFPHTPTDGVARIFSLAPMPQPGIEFTLAQLHLFGGP